MIGFAQNVIWNWGIAAFGPRHMNNRYERALRMLEEAAEAAQAIGVPKEKADLCIQTVYSRQAGAAYNELGGTLVTTLAMCSSLGFKAEDVLQTEILRITSQPFEKFAKRNQEKIDAGLA